MGRELSLDEVSNAMQNLQNGNTNGNTLQWRDGGFEMSTSYEPQDSTASPVNDVSRKPFWR